MTQNPMKVSEAAYIVDRIINHRDHLKVIMRSRGEFSDTIKTSREVLADAANEIDRLLLENLKLREAHQFIERAGRNRKDSGWGYYQDGYAAGLKESADIYRAAFEKETAK